MITLVAVASRHGSTREIAEAIGEELIRNGHAVEVRDVGTVEGIDEYEAIVLGSAIYMGQWQREALDFIEQSRERMRTIPVWLFSSGPIGDELFPKEEPPITAELIEKTGARGHRSFAGKLDRSSLGFGERLVSKVVRAPEGDYRNWKEIREWAQHVAATMNEIASMTAGSER